MDWHHDLRKFGADALNLRFSRRFGQPMDETAWRGWNGRWIYVTAETSNTVSVIDTATEKLTATVPVGKRPWGIAVTRDGKRFYTANGISNDVSVIDAATLKVIATIPAGKGAWGVVIGR